MFVKNTKYKLIFQHFGQTIINYCKVSLCHNLLIINNMKSSEELLIPHILLFWSLPSISMINEYKTKSDKLNQAITHLKSVKVITHNNKVLKLESVGLEAERYYGFENIKGSIKKVLLNINNIKIITLL